MKTKIDVDLCMNDIEKCFNILKETIELNQPIADVSWIASIHLLVGHMLKEKGASYKIYCDHMDQSKKISKPLWD